MLFYGNERAKKNSGAPFTTTTPTRRRRRRLLWFGNTWTGDLGVVYHKLASIAVIPTLQHLRACKGETSFELEKRFQNG